jgi:hypothetical protein
MGIVSRLSTSLLSISAVNFEELTNVVSTLLPSQRITDPGTNPSPSTVSVKSEESTSTDKGKRLVTEGMTVSVLEPEVCPSGFRTVIGKVPTVPISVERIDAANFVALIKVVERLRPLKRTTAPATKFEPLTVIVNVPVPALTLEGVRLVIEGVPDWVKPGLGASTNRPITTITGRMIATIRFLIDIITPW